MLAAVRVARHRRARRRTVASLAAAAAVVLAVQLATPAAKSGQDVPGGSAILLAADRAKPQLAELDRAERELEAALRDTPDDRDLTDRLRALRAQREAFERLVKGAAS